MTDPSSTGVPTFDLTLAAQMHYRAVVRFPRLAGVGFLAGLCALVMWRLLTVGFDILITPVIAGIPVLAWIVAFLAAPGPTVLRDDGPSVEFVYRRGHVRRVAFDGPRLRFRLLERSPRTPPSLAGQIFHDSDHFLLISYERIALSEEAYHFLQQKAAAGYDAIASMSPGGRGGEWRVSKYARRRVE